MCIAYEYYWNDFCCRSLPNRSGSLGLAAFMCSLVTEVKLNFKRELQTLSCLGYWNLNNSVVLEFLRNVWGRKFLFLLAPLLMAFGKSQTLLKLEIFIGRKLDIGVIFDSNCPLLSNLHIIYVNVKHLNFLDSRKYCKTSSSLLSHVTLITMNFLPIT